MDHFVILNLEKAIKEIQLSSEQAEAFSKMFFILENSRNEPNINFDEIYHLLDIVDSNTIRDIFINAFIYEVQPAIETLNSIRCIFTEDQLKVSELINARFEIVGKVLSCHSLIENLMREYISLHRKEWNKLKYKDLIGMIAFMDESDLVKTALIELNKIRNIMAHDLKVNLASIKSPYIDKLLLHHDKDNLLCENFSIRVSEFTVIIINLISLKSDKIKNLINEMKQHYEKTPDGTRRIK